MRKRGLSVILALVLALSMSFSSVASAVSSDGEIAAVTEIDDEEEDDETSKEAEETSEEADEETEDSDEEDEDSLTEEDEDSDEDSNSGEDADNPEENTNSEENTDDSKEDQNSGEDNVSDNETDNSKDSDGSDGDTADSEDSSDSDGDTNAFGDNNASDEDADNSGDDNTSDGDTANSGDSSDSGGDTADSGNSSDSENDADSEENDGDSAEELVIEGLGTEELVIEGTVSSTAAMAALESEGTEETEEGEEAEEEAAEGEGEEEEEEEEEKCDHDYEVEWTWADDYASATLTLTCSECEDVQTVDAAVTTRQDGDTTILTATATYDGVEYTDTKTAGLSTASTTVTGTGYTWDYDGDTSGLSTSEYTNNSTTYTLFTITGSGTLTLTSDISARVVVGALNSTTYKSSKITVTIDLAGHTMTGDQANSVILVGDYTSVTLMDSSSDGSGAITAGGGTRGTSFSSSITYSNGNYQWGGNVAVGTGATFTLSSGTIKNCYYTNTGGIIHRGGGVYVYDGTFIMNGGTISGNVVTGAGGGVYVYRGYFEMNGGTISGNKAWGSSGAGVQLGEGDNSTSGTYCVTAKITGGTITDNKADYHGGGIYVCNSNLTISGGTITNNTAYASSEKGAGGGIWVNKNGKLTMTGGTITGNTAYAGGGVAVGNDGWLNNSMEDNAGGDEFYMSGGTISGNYAVMYGANVSVGCSGKVPAKDDIDNSDDDGQSTFVMSGGTISSNAASSTGSSTYTTYGGGVFVSGNSSFVMSGGSISNCTATYGGGVGAGAYYTNGSHTGSKGNITLSGGTIESCTATYGGGIFATNSSTVKLSGATIENCTAKGTGSLGEVYGGGGGVYARDGSTVTLSGATITNCTAEGTGNASGSNSTGRGGGIFLYTSTLTMTDGTISDCEAEGHYSGGGVFVMRSDFTMSGGTISNCSGLRGGGVCIDDGGTGDEEGNTGIYETTLSGGTITGCSASETGGGVYLYGNYGAELTVSGATITGCTATSGKGGGIRACSGTTVEMTGGTVTGNSAATGGGIYADGSTVTMSGGTITENTASGTGGGVYVTHSGSDSASFTATGGVLANNTATTAAADVYCSSGSSISLAGTTAVNEDTEYQDSGCYITGWYKDEQNDKYNWKSNVTNELTSTVASATSGTEYFIIAALSGYNVYYDANADDATGSTTDSNLYAAGETVTVQNNGFTRNGYVFVGWSTSSGTSEETTVSSASGLLETLLGSFAITAMAAETSVTAQYITDTDKSTADAAGVTFSGSTSDEFTMPAKDVTLYAQWMKLYTVTYSKNANDATGSTTDSNEYVSGAEVSVASNGFSRKGYIFVGWNTASDGSGTSYITEADGSTAKEAGASVSDDAASTFTMPSSNVTLYAQWVKGYSLTYDGNEQDGGTVSNVPEDDKLYVSGTTVELSEDVPTHTDVDVDGEATKVVFVGWSATETTKIYASGEKSELPDLVESVTFDDADITVYAVWGYDVNENGTPDVLEDTYTVTYTDGVDNEEVFEDQVYSKLLSGLSIPVYVDDDGEETTPTREGYTFLGWSTDGETVLDLTDATVTGDITYIAVWAEIVYTVTYTDGVDGEEVFEDESTKVASDASVPDYSGGTPTREGYTFLGWSTDGETVLDLTDATVTGDITYIAVWAEVVYTVTYTDGVDDEEVFEDESTKVASGAAVPDYSGGTPTREGYTFLGWSTDGETVLDLTDATVTGDITYIAVWEAAEEEETEEETTEEETTEEEETTATVAATTAATGALAIIKVDSATGERLAGATFALYNDTEGTLIGYYKTDSNGYLVTSQLTLNYTYSFVEVGAPDGYVLDSTPHTVLLTSTLSSSADSPYVLTIANTAETSVLDEEREIEDDGTTTKDEGEVLGTDREGVESTGDDSNILLWLVLLLAAGAGLAAAIVAMKRRRT